jgi:glycerate 2-kinase
MTRAATTVQQKKDRGVGTELAKVMAALVLSFAIELDGMEKLWAIAADTDGIDGTEDNAGAVIGPHTLARARAAGLDARAMLSRHDSYGFFSALGDLLVTGPTRTNVNDYRAILVL